MWLCCMVTWEEIDELVQERRNSIANALELRLSCTNLSKWVMTISHPLRSWKKCPLPGKKSWQEISEFWWIMYYAPKWLLHMALYQAWFPNIQPIPAIKHFFSALMSHGMGPAPLMAWFHAVLPAGQAYLLGDSHWYYIHTRQGYTLRYATH